MAPGWATILLTILLIIFMTFVILWVLQTFPNCNSEYIRCCLYVLMWNAFEVYGFEYKDLKGLRTLNLLLRQTFTCTVAWGGVWWGRLFIEITISSCGCARVTRHAQFEQLFFMKCPVSLHRDNDLAKRVCCCRARLLLFVKLEHFLSSLTL